MRQAACRSGRMASEWQAVEERKCCQADTPIRLVRQRDQGERPDTRAAVFVALAPVSYLRSAAVQTFEPTSG